MNDFHVCVVYRSKVLRTLSSILLEAMILVEIVHGRDLAWMRRDDRVLEVTLFLESLHKWASHGI